MEREFRERLIDFFDPWDLVEFLGLSTEDIVNNFEDEITDCADDLEEFMEIGVRH